MVYSRMVSYISIMCIYDLPVLSGGFVSCDIRAVVLLSGLPLSVY